MTVREKEAIAKAPSGRPTRNPIGVRNILTVKGKDPNYVYRIVNDVDDGDRVQRFIEAGYEIVSSDSVTVGDRRVGNPSSEGSVARISVGGGKKGIVMRQKREWYEEDQARKAAEIDATEQSIKPDSEKGMYGKFTMDRK